MEYNLSGFYEGLSKLNIHITDDQCNQFIQYYEYLIEKNKVMNLTAITDFDEVIVKHFLDSLSLVKVLNLSDQTLIDVGTGAGFPGIPLKIAFPSLHVTLFDSLQKRVHFLNDVIELLHLDNITAVHGRAEDFGNKKEFRQQFDICVSRAVANLSTLSEYCLPFVSVDGQFVSYKSGDIENEVEAARSAIFLLGGRLRSVLHFELGNSKRSFVCIDKIKGTPKQYPRKAGTPSKKPL